MVFLGALMSGLLFGIAIIVPHAWPLALIGIIPFLLIVRGATVRRALFAGLIFGFTMNGFALYGVFWTPLPLDWAGLGAHVSLQYAFAAAMWSMSCVVFALPFMLWGAYARTHRGWFDVLTLPCAWILAEWMGAFLYAVGAYAPGIIVEPHFGIGFLGNVLADDMAFLQLASIGGVYILSGVLVAFGTGLLRVAQSEGRARKIGVMCIALTLGVWAISHLYIARTPFITGDVSIALVSTQIPAGLGVSEETYANYLQTGKNLFEEARAEKPDLIIFPEGSAFLMDDTIPRGSGVINSGREYDSHGRMIAYISHFDGTSGTTAYSFKQVLLPVGEYVPAIVYPVSSLLNVRGALETIASYRNYISGPSVRPHVVNGIRIGVRLCNEVLSPTLYQKLAREGAQIFVNASSQDWFHESRLVDTQLIRAARIRAVESHRFYVQATNTAPSFALDWYGRTIATTEWGEERILNVQAARSETVTPFAYVGTWILLFPLCVLVLVSVRRRNA